VIEPDQQICTITNSRFSWILAVDGYTIAFQGSYNAEYFKQHYSALGYKVIEKEEDQDD